MTKQKVIVAIALLLTSCLAVPLKGHAVVQGSDCPLCCGDFSLMMKGGITPALYTDRGPIWLVVPTLTPPVFSTHDDPTFDEQFHLPWAVGAEFAYNTSQRGQLFLEYTYAQAGGKLFVDSSSSNNLFSDYKTHSGYLGVRHYFAPWSCLSCCGPITPYIGFKAGLVWQQQVAISLTVNGLLALSAPYALSQTAISGGLQVGGEWCFSGCWSLVLQGEFIATQGLHTNPNALFSIIPGVDLPSNVFLGALGWVATFPITLGLRWTF